MHKGSCLCGKVRFTVSGDLSAADACHCQSCRKSSGHYFVSTETAKSNVVILDEEYLTWFQSSEKVRRGFCSVCGSNLFWDPVFKDWTAIAMGAFDGETGVKLALHIFVGEKGEYYDICDGLPQNDP